MKKTMIAAVAGVLALGALGCEEEKKGPPPEPQFELPGSSPLALTKANRGVELWPTVTLVDGHGARLAERSASAETLVIYEQLSSEYVMARTAVFANAKLENRLEDLFSEPKLADAMAGYGRKVFVVDPLRLDQTWIVDASRGTRGDAAGRESFLNFGDAGYREDAAMRIVSAITDAGVVPEAVVIGSEMERYYLLNPTDWSNFASFFAEVRAVSTGRTSWSRLRLTSSRRWRMHPVARPTPSVAQGATAQRRSAASSTLWPCRRRGRRSSTPSPSMP
jgi:hypothetical protein